MYSLEELKRIINNMTEKMFLSRYDMRDNVRHSSVGHRFRDFEAKIVAENILLSDKEL